MLFFKFIIAKKYSEHRNTEHPPLYKISVARHRHTKKKFIPKIEKNLLDQFMRCIGYQIIILYID